MKKVKKTASKTTTTRVKKWKAAVVAKAPTITMTANQALTLKKALGSKSYKFLDKKLEGAFNV